MRHRTKPQKHHKLRQKKLSRAVQLAVLSMSLTPGTVLADVQLDEGGGAAASALTTITNTATIAPAGDYLNVDAANTQLTGAITNESGGTINAESDAIEVVANSTISGAITNSGTITAVEDAFSVNTSTISGGTNAINIINATAPIAITNSGLIDGAVILDDSTLALEGLTGRVTGAVRGAVGSTILDDSVYVVR